MEPDPIRTSLCARCIHHRDVITAKGTRFLLCRLHALDARYAKYPPQPVLRCSGYESGRDDEPAGS